MTCLAAAALALLCVVGLGRAGRVRRNHGNGTSAKVGPLTQEDCPLPRMGTFKGVAWQHIYARHLSEIDDALDVFFDTKATWNEQFRRFENYSNTHGLFWFWLNESKKEVQIISCFRI
jgi:hypothetical protein